MADRVYFRHRQIGVGVRTVDTRTSRQGLATFQGNDQEGVHLSKESPNFLHEHSVYVPFHGEGWSQKDLHEALDALENGLVVDALEHGDGPLAWIKDDTHTTTTSNAETTGSDVVVEVGSLAALNVSVDDWVLIYDVGEDVAVLAQVEDTDTGPDSITIDLTEDIPAGSIVWKAWIGYPGSVYDSGDRGTPPEQGMDFVRAITIWRFFSGTRKVMSAAP